MAVSGVEQKRALKPEVVTVTLPLPPAALSPNSRVHWARRARAVRSYRRRAAEEAKIVMIEAGLPPRVCWRRAEIQVRYFHKTRAFRDKDNIQASLKAAYDGLCDAGLLSDDRDVDFPSPVREKDSNRPRVELTISCAEDRGSPPIFEHSC